MTIRNRKDHIPVPGDPADGNVVFLYECITNYIIFCIVTVLPMGNGFIGHAELFSELLLRHTFLFSQGGYEFPDSDLIHFYIPPGKNIAQLPRECLPHKQRIPLDKPELLSFYCLLNHLSFFRPSHQPIVFTPQQRRLQRNDFSSQRHFLHDLLFA